MVRLVVILIFGSLLMGCSDEFPNSDSFAIFPDNRSIGLPTPTLSLGIGIETGDGQLHWQAVAEATQYTIERDISPIFLGPTQLNVGNQLLFDLGSPENYPWRYYYRLRAENSIFISDWSRVVAFP